MSTGRHRNARIIHWQREEADIRWTLGVAQLSVSSLSPLLPNDAQKHGRATSERRERASIHDQSLVKNKLRDIQLFFSSLHCTVVCTSDMLVLES